MLTFVGLAYTLENGKYRPQLSCYTEAFQRTVRLAPKFALCLALLSYVAARGYIRRNLHQRSALGGARPAFETALALALNLGEAWVRALPIDRMRGTISKPQCVVTSKHESSAK